VQQALTEAGVEAAAYQRQTYRDSDAKLYDKLVEAGVNVTKPDVGPFRAEVEKIYANYITTDEQKRLVELLMAVK
jgi:TRAP-type C4-dicarboxylate transport system substrate-binding protein